jgi:hypothetical protein
MSKLKPWESKTVDQLTQAEILEWVEWAIQRDIPNQQPWQLAQDIVHNVLLWERERVKALSQSS